MILSMIVPLSDMSLLLLYRQRGGVEEERAERQRWQDEERKKIMDSVNG